MAPAARIEQLRGLSPVFRARDAIAAGLSWRDLYELRDAGVVVSLSRGVYQLVEAAGSDVIDFVAVSRRAPHGTVCLNSALAYWDLSDENPAVVHLAVPKGATRPKIDHPPTVVHVFETSTFELGRQRVDGADGTGFWITDPERTVVDVHRLRRRLGPDLAAAAMRRYTTRPGRDLVGLMDYAKQLRADRALRSDLQVLLA